MTIKLIPEVESAVCEAARRQGTTPKSGYYARRLSSSEDFAAHEKEEIALEERRWKA